MLKFAAALLVPALVLGGPLGEAPQPVRTVHVHETASAVPYSANGQPPRYSTIALSGPGGWVRPAM
jgi:hypothetical protein